MQSESGSFDPRGPVAEVMADLWWLMLALGVAVFLIFAVFLALSLFRRRGPDEPDHPADTDSRPPSRRWIVSWGVLMPLVVLLVVFGATVRAMQAMPAEPPGALVVEVTGHQWWWEIHYPQEQVTTANELRIPVGRPVSLRLTSDDVIHSFWVPRLAGKIDLLPDRTNTLVLEAAEAGEYRGHCAEFCGLQHARMRMIVLAEPEEAFADWVRSQQGPAAEPAEPASVRGREIFLQQQCASCHTIEGTGAGATEGPDLTHIASRRTLGAATMPNTAENLRAWITDPDSVKMGVKMPAAELPEDDVDALVGYLESLE